MAKSKGVAGQYQRCMPITSKNLGKNQFKMGVGSESQGAAESKAAARRRKQMEKKEAKENG